MNLISTENILVLLVAINVYTIISNIVSYKRFINKITEVINGVNNG